MGNLIVSAVLILIVGAIIRTLWKAHGKGAACSVACTSCPIVDSCAKDSTTIKQELRQELNRH